MISSGRHRWRWLPAAALLALGACGSDGSGSRPTASDASVASASDASTVASTPSSSAGSAASPDALGTLTIRIRAETAGSTDDLADELARRARDIVDSLGVEEASVTTDGDLVVVVIEHEPDLSERFADYLPVSHPGFLPVSQVEIHPVLQCVQPATDAGTSASTDPEAASEPVQPSGEEILPTRDGSSCFVGPVWAGGTIFDADAKAEIVNGSWTVTVELRPGAAGEDVWNAAAERCFAGDETCPTRQLAIVISGVIVSAPTVNAPRFSGAIQIAGSFSEAEADEIAQTFRIGAEPVMFVIEESTFVPD